MDDGDDRKKRSKTKSAEASTSSTPATPNTMPCPHPIFAHGVCVLCKRPESQCGNADAYIPLTYIHRTYKIKPENLNAYRRGSLRHWADEKKLVLVLDLDHTLLHTTKVATLSDDEKHLLTYPIDGLCKMGDTDTITKLRPFVHKFLKEARKLCRIYVYTTAGRKYAANMCIFLRLTDVSASKRVVTRDDCTRAGEKSLDILLEDERFVVILDDMESLWAKHRRNLVRVRSYNFFANDRLGCGTANKPFSELRTDEGSPDGRGGGEYLEDILDLLRRVHGAVFDQELGVDLSTGDARQVLEKLRRDVLAGCSIVFDKRYVVWLMAEELGARCTAEVHDSATHVVSAAAVCGSSRHARWAVRHGKQLVTPEWIEAAYYSWKRPPEKDFTPAAPTCDASVEPICESNRKALL